MNAPKVGTCYCGCGRQTGGHFAPATTSGPPSGWPSSTRSRTPSSHGAPGRLRGPCRSAGPQGLGSAPGATVRNRR
jgi:hypothetical protein